MSRFTAVLVFLIAVTWVSAPSARGGDWHYGVNLVCSDCHTQHNSSNGQPMRTDNDSAPARQLLRRGTALDLCLSCHDGSKPDVPDVLAPIAYVSESAAGAFPNSGAIATAKAHHLANATPEMPPGGTVAMVVTCTTCHDPHGNDNYRNLRPDPTRTNLLPVNVTASQTNRANGSNAAQVYVRSNIIYKSNVSKWCSQCHGTQAHHSADKPLWGSTIADFAIWTGVSAQLRVPVLSPSDNVVPSSDDQVMCLSCHKAHGSDNDHHLLYADGVALDSTCAECHNP